jgi:hypothetical protein
MSAKEIDTGVGVKDDIVRQNPQLSVVLVGKPLSGDGTFKSLNIFQALKDLNLARLRERVPVSTDDGKSKGAAADAPVAAKKKDKGEKIKPINLVKDKESGLKYLVDPLPSVIISITGDAQDMPEDDDFIKAADDLVESVKKTLTTSGEGLKLDRVAASRAISMMTAWKKEDIKEAVDKLPLCNSAEDLMAKLTVEKPPPPSIKTRIKNRTKEAVDKPPLPHGAGDHVAPRTVGTKQAPIEAAASRAFDVIKDKQKELKAASSTCMQLSLLLQLRMQELEVMKHMTFFDNKGHEYTLDHAFNHFPSARDVMLNVSKDAKVQFLRLKEYRFPESDGSNVVFKPVGSGKSRYLSCLRTCM